LSADGRFRGEADKYEHTSAIFPPDGAMKPARDFCNGSFATEMFKAQARPCPLRLR
jgi:hypothetical protein